MHSATFSIKHEMAVVLPCIRYGFRLSSKDVQIEIKKKKLRSRLTAVDIKANLSP
jgi:hypothetical protein